MQVNIKLENPEGWNRVNIRNLNKILDNSQVSCRGHYTDDYAHDADVGFETEKNSEECKTKIKEMSLVPELYWDKDHFLIFYGHWLSYDAFPKKDLKLNFISAKKEEIPKDIEGFAKELENAMLIKLKVNGVDCQGNRDGIKVNVKAKKKYFYVDVGSSGKFLIDQERIVYTIKAYGQKGYYVGLLPEVVNKLAKDMETMNRVLNENLRIYSLGVI